MSKCLEKLALIQKVFEKLAEWNAYDLSKLDKDFETNFDLDFLELEKELKEYEQYKAIEKELGIDIPTYFKIRKAEKVYTKDELGRIDEKYLRDNVDGLSVFSEGFASIPECDQTLYISGYGKDWALNKEDLEKWKNT